MIKRNRLVALFDILGFGSRLKTGDLAVIRRELRLFVRTIRSEAFTNSGSNISRDNDNLDTARFVFDSVLLISHDVANGRDVHNFIFACIRLLELGFSYRFPFRGSIAIGDVFSDEETGLILGPELSNLRDAEQSQDWSGCFLHSNAAEIVFDAICGKSALQRDTENPRGWQPLHLLDVPLKPAFPSRAPFKRWCLNWAYLLDQRIIEPGLEYFRAAPEKYTNTKQYVEYVRNLPQNLTPPTDSKNLPAGVMAKALQSRWGFRLSFVNNEGHIVPIPAGTLHWEVRSLDSDFSESGIGKLESNKPKLF